MFARVIRGAGEGHIGPVLSTHSFTLYPIRPFKRIFPVAKRPSKKPDPFVFSDPCHINCIATGISVSLDGPAKCERAHTVFSTIALDFHGHQSYLQHHLNDAVLINIQYVLYYARLFQCSMLRKLMRNLKATDYRVEMDLADMMGSCPVTLNGITGQSYFAFVKTLVAAQCALYTPNIYPSNYAPFLKDGDEFDFIVVGGGSAGSILTKRLSENSNWKVLLLEAGDYPSALTEIPRLFFTIFNTKEDWGYVVEKTKGACLSANNSMCVCPRGKVLGGSSNLNGMVYIRGNRKDFDNWANKGNLGWDYDSVLESYKKFEDLHGAEDERMGKGGELIIKKQVNENPVRKELINAYQEIGYGAYTEERPEGYMDSYVTIFEGQRYSAAKAFLTKVKGLKNVKIALNSQVAKVCLGSDLQVEGVQVRINNKLIRLKASKEVILSAGTINSPQILMNSGIGPKEHLEELGIPVRKDLSVGENLQDHVSFGGMMMTVGPKLFPKTKYETSFDYWYEYLMYKKGPFTMGSIENFLFLVNSKNYSVYPKLQLYYTLLHRYDKFGTLSVMQTALQYPPELITTQNEQIKESDAVLLVPSLTYPASVGKVLLRSTDPFEKPKIFTNYFTDKNNEDVNTLLDGVRFYQNLFKTKAFAKHNPKLVNPDLVNCRGFEYDSDNFWRCAIRNLAGTVYHVAGTCKMGPKDDRTAVVDNRLRVYGVKGLRVVDASIMPSMISTNINAAVMMIGQKASEMIEEDWSQQPYGTLDVSTIVMNHISNVLETCSNGFSGSSSQLFLTLLQTLISAKCNLEPEGRYPIDYGPRLNEGEEFDFIIVGAGAAGSILANRLSEVQGWKILLLEAGTYPSAMTEVPGLFNKLPQTREDWNITTERTEGLGLKNERHLYPRGKVLGGSTSINAMLYLRSTKKDHDEWVRMGNSGWDWNTALKYYENFENVDNDNKGELNISKIITQHPIKDVFIQSYTNLGIKKHQQNGFEDAYMTVFEGTRSNAAKAFLSKIANHQNFYLGLNAHVTKLLFDENGRVNGIEVMINNRHIKIYSKKEVILSAGSINSAQILLHSGIGPKEHLENLGIPARRNLKVGENFQDHVIFLGLFVDVDESVFPPWSEKNTLDEMYDYLVHQKGPYSMPPLQNFQLHMNTKKDDEFPNLQINQVVCSRNKAEHISVGLKVFNFADEIVQLILEHNRNTSGIILFPKALTPKSRGKLLLRSNDPFDMPLIFPNYLSEEEDLEVLLDGINFIKRLLRTEPFKSINPKIFDLQLENCKMFEFDTDNYWRCAIKYLITHLHHPCGTCKMGPESDPDAVVAPNLKIHGVEGIRVADASIMPQLPRANTMATTILIGAKAADLIKNDWLKDRTEL
ncbi:hypothetical protein FQA39_LY16374 [Lamprigera yunnana]|nr:hypothetical protein FQA39_LY16374 [Lamprigera yunnana]